MFLGIGGNLGVEYRKIANAILLAMQHLGF